jgi:MAP kinase interacting serine/threonine kinase
MAPEVVDVWQYQAWSYDKRCDLWSLGTILYILLCGYRPFYAHCGNDCGFDEGLACEDCQELLFKCIQQGVYTFDDPNWTDISADAKDLIQHLLVKNPYQRYTAEQVLRHPWLAKESSKAPLATPYILSRNNSVRELGMFAGTANAVNRLIQRHLSINEVVCSTAPSFQHEKQDDDDKLQRTPDAGDETVCSSPDNGRSVPHRERGIFHLGLSEEDDCGIGRWSDEEDQERGGLGRWSEEEADDRADEFNDTESGEPNFALWTNLSPPGDSRLAKRRAFKVKHTSEGSVDSGNVSGSSSPPDICLADI